MSIPREQYQQNYDAGTAYKVDGALLNKQGGVLEGVSNQPPRAHDHVVNGYPMSPPPNVIGIATITNAGSSGCGGDDPSDAPCAQENLYLGRFRYYEPDTKNWVDYEEDLQIDAGGYWEGVYDEDDAEYKTEVSRSPTTGPDYGAIPAFGKGDQVPCFYDEQRGFLIPIISPPADPPGGEMGSTTTVTIPDVNTQHAAIFSFDVKEPGGDWQSVHQCCIRLPEVAEKGFVDSRSFSCIFAARSDGDAGALPIDQSTQMRIRMGKRSNNNIYVTEIRLRMFQIGRLPERNFVKTYAVQKYLPDGQGSVHQDGWDIRKSVTGRFKDSTLFVLDNQGQKYAYHADGLDGAMCRAQVDVTIYGDPIYDSELSESDLSESDLSESDLSESGHQEYCTVFVVSDVHCNIDGTIDEICYRTIAIPRIGGWTCGQQIGAENCVPCTVETSSSSSSSLILTSSSTQQLTTSSSSTQQLTTSSSTSSAIETSSSSTLALTSSSSSTVAQTSSLSSLSSSSSVNVFTTTIQDTIAQPPF